MSTIIKGKQLDLFTKGYIITTANTAFILLINV
jgi:hypothetical protein